MTGRPAEPTAAPIGSVEAAASVAVAKVVEEVSAELVLEADEAGGGGGTDEAEADSERFMPWN